MEPRPAKPGDFFEFFAEIDLLCAISTCPSADLSEWGWGPDGADPVANCHPIKVELYEVGGDVLEGWKPPEPVRIDSVYERGARYVRLNLNPHSCADARHRIELA